MEHVASATAPIDFENLSWSNIVASWLSVIWQAGQLTDREPLVASVLLVFSWRFSSHKAGYGWAVRRLG
jgi:hypothetical protein